MLNLQAFGFYWNNVEKINNKCKILEMTQKISENTYSDVIISQFTVIQVGNKVDLSSLTFLLIIFLQLQLHIHLHIVFISKPTYYNISMNTIR